MKKSSRTRRIEQGEEMPKDFWNYSVNPILGYYVESVFSTRKTGSYVLRDR